MADKSRATCSIQTFCPDFRTSYADWLAIGHLLIGPSEVATGRAQFISGLTLRSLAQRRSGRCLWALLRH